MGLRSRTSNSFIHGYKQTSAVLSMKTTQCTFYKETNSRRKSELNEILSEKNLVIVNKKDLKLSIEYYSFLL